MNDADWKSSIELARATNARLGKQIAMHELGESKPDIFTGFNLEGHLVRTSREGVTVDSGLKIDNGILEYGFDCGDHKSVSAFSKENSLYQDVTWLVNRILKWRERT